VIKSIFNNIKVKRRQSVLLMV